MEENLLQVSLLAPQRQPAIVRGADSNSSAAQPGGTGNLHSELSVRLSPSLVLHFMVFITCMCYTADVLFKGGGNVLYKE